MRRPSAPIPSPVARSPLAPSTARASRPRARVARLEPQGSAAERLRLAVLTALLSLLLASTAVPAPAPVTPQDPADEAMLETSEAEEAEAAVEEEVEEMSSLSPVREESAPAPAPAVAEPSSTSCGEGEAAFPDHFDFWIGDWQLESRYRTAENEWTDERGADRITRVLGGCALLQEWEGEVGGQAIRGLSLTSWLPDRKVWQQAWSDSSGPNLLLFTGTWDAEAERMVLVRELEVEGEPQLRRQVYENISADALDWSYEASDDGGETWTSLWKIHYTRGR